MKRDLRRLLDSEGYVHFAGAGQCVNGALCGNNDTEEETDDVVSCVACIAQIVHIYSHRKPKL